MSITVNNWFHAEALFAGARDKEYGRVLDKNTRLQVSRRVHGRYSKDLIPSEIVYSIVHFRTEIIQIYLNGTYGITPNGWSSTTTKKRIRQHSPVALFTNKGVSWLGGYRWGMPIDTSEEYIVDVNRRVIRDPSGLEVSTTLNVGAPRALPKSRNPLNKAVRGDVLRSPSGQHWVVARMPSPSKALYLAEYLGDMPAFRSYAAVGDGVMDLSPLLLLSLDGWTAVPRFEIRAVNHDG